MIKCKCVSPGFQEWGQSFRSHLPCAILALCFSDSPGKIKKKKTFTKEAFFYWAWKINFDVYLACWNVLPPPFPPSKICQSLALHPVAAVADIWLMLTQGSFRCSVVGVYEGPWTSIVLASWAHQSFGNLLWLFSERALSPHFQWRPPQPLVSLTPSSVLTMMPLPGQSSRTISFLNHLHPELPWLEVTALCFLCSLLCLP